MKHNLYLLGRFRPYFKRYKGILLLDLFCASLTTGSEMILPLILRHLANLGMQGAGLLTAEAIVKCSVLFASIKLIELFAGYYMANVGHIMGAKIETDMRSDLYSHLQTLSDEFYNENKVGQIMSRLTNDLFDITEFAHHCPEEYFIGGIKIAVSFVILFNTNPILTIAIYVTIPMMILLARRFNKGMRYAQKAQRKQIGELNSRIEDSISGVRVVKSFANEDIEIEKFEMDNSKFLGIKKMFYRSFANFLTVTRLFDGIMYLIVIALGGVLMLRGEIAPPDMIIYIMYVGSMLMTVRRIVEFTEQFQKGITGIERFAEIMDEKPNIVDAPNAVKLENVRGEISLENVTFRYAEDLDNVLTDFSMRVKSGENVAIVGPSGEGKTTICSLIPRFWDVNEGAVKIDGIDVRNIALHSLRNNIGIVQQDVYMFSGSIRANILYGRPDATQEDVEEAARLAGAYDFIIALEDGFDTYVGERGVKLSGGQKQRISIARVFLKNPPILILDEATSALDNKSEIVVQESLEQLTKGRTTITIAHRLSTVVNADRIIVMANGGIAEEGTHAELLALKGYYYQLYNKI